MLQLHSRMDGMQGDDGQRCGGWRGVWNRGVIRTEDDLSSFATEIDRFEDNICQRSIIDYAS